MKRYKFLSAALLGAALTMGTVTSCSNSGYLDINYNPNYPTTASYKQLLPSAEASIVAVSGLYQQITGDFWCQYVTQGNSTNQYNTLANYSVTTGSSMPPVTSLWQNSYANILEDLKLALSSAETSGAWNYWMVAKILQAYSFLMLTDSYGDIPFTEALDIENHPHAAFDDSKSVVYPGIIEMLDAALAKLDDAKTADKADPIGGVTDCYLGGSLDKWAAFAKSLKLKMYLKDFDAHKSDIQALLTAGGLLEEDCAWTSWEDATNKGNPLYEYNIRQLNTTENIRACHTFSEYLLRNKDPRIIRLYEVTVNSSGIYAYSSDADLIEHMDLCYEGLPCGTKPPTDESQNGGIPITKSSRMKQAYSDAVYLMNKAECKLMIAEAYARLGDADQAAVYYCQGVEAGFARFGLEGYSAEMLDGVYKFDRSDMIRSIAMQYWLSYAGANAYDGWMTRNRLGIPEIQKDVTVRKSNAAGEHELSDGYTLGNLVDPGASNLNAGEYPMRLLYPTNTTLYNTAAASYVEANGNSVTKKLWWEK